MSHRPSVCLPVGRTRCRWLTLFTEHTAVLAYLGDAWTCPNVGSGLLGYAAPQAGHIYCRFSKGYAIDLTVDDCSQVYRELWFNARGRYFRVGGVGAAILRPYGDIGSSCSVQRLVCDVVSPVVDRSLLDQTLFRQTTRFYSLTYIIGHRCTRIRRDRMRSHAPQSPHIKIEGRLTRGTAGFPPKSALPSSGLRNSTTDNMNTRTSSDVRA